MLNMDSKKKKKSKISRGKNSNKLTTKYFLKVTKLLITTVE